MKTHPCQPCSHYGYFYIESITGLIKKAASICWVLSVILKCSERRCTDYRERHDGIDPYMFRDADDVRVLSEMMEAPEIWGVRPHPLQGHMLEKVER